MKTGLMQGTNYCSRSSFNFTAISTLIQPNDFDFFFSYYAYCLVVKQNCQGFIFVLFINKQFRMTLSSVLEKAWSEPAASLLTLLWS